MEKEYREVLVNMRTALIGFAVLLAVIACFSGCYPPEPAYGQQDADRISETGAELMRAWLNENMPGAVLRECTAATEMWKEDRSVYLTGYASGSIEVSGETKHFAVDTVNGDVYFAMDTDTLEALKRETVAYFLENMGIDQNFDGNLFSCNVMAPAHGLQQFDSFDYGLPAGVEDLRAFVRDPLSRPQICIREFQISLLDDRDLSPYDLKAMEKLEIDCGLRVDYADIIGSGERVVLQNKAVLFTESGCWLKGEGYELRGVVRIREEKRDAATNEITVTERHFDPQADLIFEETKNGFRFSFPNEDWKQGFRFYADADSELLRHGYVYRFGDHESTLSWKELHDGSYVMITKNQNYCDFNLDGKLERIE
ncbi:MAG: hypothetical protein IJO10_10230 [Clostridia bacterium]|nr:hypothetical protein [Clostridia bacterium]